MTALSTYICQETSPLTPLNQIPPLIIPFSLIQIKIDYEVDIPVLFKSIHMASLTLYYADYFINSSGIYQLDCCYFLQFTFVAIRFQLYLSAKSVYCVRI